MADPGRKMGARHPSIPKLRALLRRLTPRRRAQLVRFLERASDNPFLTDHNRRRVDRYLLDIKAILHFEEAMERAVRDLGRVP